MKYPMRFRVQARVAFPIKRYLEDVQDIYGLSNVGEAVSLLAEFAMDEAETFQFYANTHAQEYK